MTPDDQHPTQQFLNDRKRLDSLSDLAFLTHHTTRHIGQHRRVFRDYLTQDADIYAVQSKLDRSSLT